MSKFLIALKKLEQWFQKKQRILPWRNDPTLYRVWVSEIMLQQTQVTTVIPYFEKFIQSFPTVESLAQAKSEEVMHRWAGLGYYSRARNLHQGAQDIVKKGRFPQNREEWLEIPGVGNYTAGAILSIALNQPEAILDGNVERVLSRLRRVARQKGDSHFKQRLWIISKFFVQTAYDNGISPSVLNQALMELGATICIPRKPRCEVCPLKKICQAKRNEVQEHYPPKKAPKKWVLHQERLHCLLNSEGEVLLRKRKKGEWRAGLWDLMDESPTQLGVRSEVLGEIETRHIVTHHKIQRVTEISKVISFSKKSPLQQMSTEDHKWVSVNAPQVPMGSALKRTLEKVVEFQRMR